MTSARKSPRTPLSKSSAASPGTKPGSKPGRPTLGATRLLAVWTKQLGRTIVDQTGHAVGLPSPSHLTRAVAFRATVTAAAGLGLLAGGGSAAWAGLQHQARLAAKRIGLPEIPPPQRDGFYLPDGHHRPRLNMPVSGDRTRTASPVTLVMLGDSTMAGYGSASADDLPGVMLARKVAAKVQRPVHLRTRAVVGSGAAGLALQVQETLLDRPDVAVISVGANDVRDRVAASVSVAELRSAVVDLTAAGIAVVVGTCPDLGVIAPIPQPLRQLAGYWSRNLADKQEQAMMQLGIPCIPLGRIVSPAFLHEPDLFSPDLFHPSGAGYARAVAALLPAVVQMVSTPQQDLPAKSEGPESPNDSDSPNDEEILATS